MFFDPMYFLFVGPALILSLVAQFWVKSAFSKYSKVGIQRGMSGAEVAQFIVRQANLGVRVERVQGFLSDHYDPTQKVLRLSPAVYDGRSVSSVGVAAHEARSTRFSSAKNYAPLAWRSCTRSGHQDRLEPLVSRPDDRVPPLAHSASSRSVSFCSAPPCSSSS
ncbi:MAG: zinc metallopeptidase [Candidatus Eisenbacteria bacterium]